MKKQYNLHELIEKIRIVRNETELSGIFPHLSPENAERPVRVAFVNAHALNLCYGNPGFLKNLVESEFVLRDGSGMKILFKMLGKNPGLNLNGTDLIPRLIELYKDKDAALLGTQEPYLSQAAAAVVKNGVNAALLLDGFRDDREYLDAVRNSRPALIVLGMGMPKQERIASLLARNLNYPCLIVCGGAILDFMGGKVSRAPLAFRKFGMEWLYRLMQEPRRLFRRYVIGNFLFLFRSFNLAFISNPR